MRLFRQREAFRILVIAGMMTCLASAAGELARRVLPVFDPAPLVALAFLVCLEGIAGDRLLRQLPEASLRLRLRLVEWVVILLLLRLVLLLTQGWEAASATLTRWLARPQALIDGGILAGALLLFIVWQLGILMAQALEALGPEADEPPPKDSAAYYAWLTRPKAASRSQGWENLRQLYLGGGAVLLICSGLARLDISAALSLRHPAVAGIILNALLYFALGLLLLAQGHFARLQARWEREGVPVSRSLARRWASLGVAFALGVALLVLLLPTRPSLALFGAVFDLLAAALGFLTALAMVGMAGLGYLLGLLARLLGLQMARGGAAPVTMPVLVQAQPAAQRLNWWEAVQGLVLWALIAGVVLYALVRFVRDRRDLWRQLVERGGPAAWVATLWRSLWRWLHAQSKQMGAAWQRLFPRKVSVRQEATLRVRWPRPRSPREQVRLLYLVAVQHLREAGWPRHPADTPVEYAGRLVSQLPEAGHDLNTLTSAFVEARYGQREMTSQDVHPVRAALQRLWARLRRARGGVDGNS
ncbi:MAG: DUF4129 domain-containing protein [Anaerolineae bacterium]